MFNNLIENTKSGIIISAGLLVIVIAIPYFILKGMSSITNSLARSWLSGSRVSTIIFSIVLSLLAGWAIEELYNLLFFIYIYSENYFPFTLRMPLLIAIITAWFLLASIWSISSKNKSKSNIA
jgi:hypothetical protein